MRKKCKAISFLLSAGLLISSLSPMGTFVTKAAVAEADREDKSIVYFVDAGDYVTNTVCKGDQLGTRNSLTDQVYGADAVTGFKWGIVDEVSNPLANGNSACGGVFTDNTWPYESNAQNVDASSKCDSNRYTKNQFENHVEVRYMDYKFELDKGEYEVEVYTTDPWQCSQSPTVLINSADATADFNNGKGTVLTANKAQVLNVNMEEAGDMTVSFRAKGDSNKAINVCYIKIVDKSKLPEATPTPEVSDEEIAKKDFTADVSAVKFTQTQLIKDIELPMEGANGSQISWVSSNENVLGIDGVVQRPGPGEPDVDVTLEATITLGKLSQKKYFSFTVLAEPSITDIQQFTIDEVQLTDDYYFVAQESDIEFLLAFENDRILSRFRETAGLDTYGEKPYGGWEDSYLGGHCVGHYLTAAAQAIKATGNEELREKLAEIITGLKECQDELGTGFIFGAKIQDKNNVEKQFDIMEGKSTGDTWVPWYNMHKLVQGLVDVYKYTGNEEALQVGSNLGDWIYNRVSTWNSGTQGRVLGTEYGGMNDCLYDLYYFTKSQDHLYAAHMFDEDSLYEKVTSNAENTLNGKHANTTIPKFVGALKRYTTLKDLGELSTDDEKYLDYAIAFWDRVVENYSYITGGVSVMEHFRQECNQDHNRTKTTCESCCAHNMLKLSRELYKLTGDKKYSDYYETTLRNSIMGTVRAESAQAAYFVPMSTGYYKTFGDADPAKNMFWCCTGSGMENFTKLGDSIYFHKDDTLIVNQYVSSKVNWNAYNMEVSLTADVTKSDVATIKTSMLNGVASQNATIALRVPDWRSAAVNVKVNGAVVKDAVSSNGYISITRDWKENDEITIQYPMAVKAFGLPDNDSVFGFMYGPTVLAAPLGTERWDEVGYAGVNLNVPVYKVVGDQEARITINYGDSNADEVLQNEILAITEEVSMREFIENINDYLVKEDSADVLTFKLVGTDADTKFADGLKFVPFNTLNDERYGIYWYFESAYEVEDESKILEKKQNGRVDASKIDSIQPGYGQYEKDSLHNLTESNSEASTIDGGGSTRYAKAGGYFSYNFKVDVTKSNSLLCRFAKEDNGKTLKVTVGNTVVAQLKLDYSGDKDFYDQYIDIPAEVVAANVSKASVTGDDGVTVAYDVINVKFESNDSSDSARLVGGLFMTKGFNNNAGITAIAETAANAPVRQNGDSYTVYMPAGASSAKLKFTLADKFGLLYVGDALVNDAKDQSIMLFADSTVLNVKAFAEDHTTSKEYTITILRGVDAPALPSEGIGKPGDSAPNVNVTTPDAGVITLEQAIAEFGKTTFSKKITAYKGANTKFKINYTDIFNKALAQKVVSIKSVKYTSQNKKIATVSKTGQIKGIKVGKTKVTVKITLSTGSSFKYTSVVTVKKPTIKITGKKVVKKGKTITLKAKGYGVKGKVKWSVSNKKVAKINSKGKLKGLKKGVVKVTAKIKKVKTVVKIKVK